MAYYITTAIAYTSKTPHIGNTYDPVFADAMARYYRQKGEDVYFLTGTDEHGQKIQQQAEAEGIGPQALVDRVAGEIRDIWDGLQVSYDQFIRTTDPKHKAIVQKIFQKLSDKGDIYLGSYEGLYCTPCESFFTESQVTDGRCPDCGAAVQSASEPAYFFRLSKYTQPLIDHIEKNPDFIRPEPRKNEMLNNFLKPGLEDLCVTRTSFHWGIPVLSDPAHVVYVWMDALSNYITALGYDPDGAHGELFLRYWPADVHVIGKDILRFHTLYWPAFLMALDVPLPKCVFGHPWLLTGQDKMSKSKGNTIYAADLLKDFSVDAVRYYLLREMPYAQDGTITRAQFVSRYNGDLANDLGNLLSRTVAMVQKYFGGEAGAPAGEATAEDFSLTNTQIEAQKTYQTCMESFQTAQALAACFTLISRANKYIDETMPWALAKDPAQKDRLMAVMFHLCEALRAAAGMLAPAMPGTAAEIERQLGFADSVYHVTKGNALFPRAVEGDAGGNYDDL